MPSPKAWVMASCSRPACTADVRRCRAGQALEVVGAALAVLGSSKPETVRCFLQAAVMLLQVRLPCTPCPLQQQVLNTFARSCMIGQGLLTLEHLSCSTFWNAPFCNCGGQLQMIGSA